MVPTLSRNSSLAETCKASATSEDYYRMLKTSTEQALEGFELLEGYKKAEGDIYM
jgi:hypothetical protein